MHGALRELAAVSEAGEMASNIAAGASLGAISERGHVEAHP